MAGCTYFSVQLTSCVWFTGRNEATINICKRPSLILIIFSSGSPAMKRIVRSSLVVKSAHKLRRANHGTGQSIRLIGRPSDAISFTRLLLSAALGKQEKGLFLWPFFVAVLGGFEIKSVVLVDDFQEMIIKGIFKREFGEKLSLNALRNVLIRSILWFTNCHQRNLHWEDPLLGTSLYQHFSFSLNRRFVATIVVFAVGHLNNERSTTRWSHFLFTFKCPQFSDLYHSLQIPSRTQLPW